MGDNELYLNDGQKQGVIHLRDCRLTIKYESNKTREAEEVATEGISTKQVPIPSQKKNHISKVISACIGDLVEILNNIPRMTEYEVRTVFMQSILLHPGEMHGVDRHQYTHEDLRSFVHHIFYYHPEKADQIIDEALRKRLLFGDKERLEEIRKKIRGGDLFPFERR